MKILTTTTTFHDLLATVAAAAAAKKSLNTHKRVLFSSCCRASIDRSTD
jgi:hypothetical protein